MKLIWGLLVSAAGRVAVRHVQRRPGRRALQRRRVQVGAPCLRAGGKDRTDQPALPAHGRAALLRGEPAPLVRRASSDALDSPQPCVAAAVGPDAGLEGVTGPECWWPEDRSRVVTSDYDPVSTYVGCSAEAAALILADEGIEALPVTPGARVDGHADAGSTAAGR
ncbi:hypothetical protein PUR71_11460 [Streptomyces sp. SP17BM10]|uniref:hypothetical protein n=1 Tax=Streptomyces sp. SP17BM10 TaxID=3002530 RepID=UPI002E78741D|nr:hypothetical protein [Streptomyces sp. SP17BM10]MEE1783520.1 hypothetical protein [Streptomyces sp. SP17BM10]